MPTTGEPKNALVSGIKTLIFPTLVEHGFRMRSPQFIGRCRDRVLQYISFNRSMWGSKRFVVVYASQPMYSNWDFIHTSYGDRLRNPADRWWPSATMDEMTEIVPEILMLIKTQALPHFERTASPAAFIRYLGGCKGDHHKLRDLGASLARLGRTLEAEEALRQSRLAYVEDGRAWCWDYIKTVDELLEALKTGKELALLNDWEQKFIAAHRLEKLL